MSPNHPLCSRSPKKPSSAKVTSCLHLHVWHAFHFPLLPAHIQASRAPVQGHQHRKTEDTAPTPGSQGALHTHAPLFVCLLLLPFLLPRQLGTQEAPLSICREAHLYSQGWTFPQGSRPPERLPRCLLGPSHLTKAQLILSCLPSWLQDLNKATLPTSR